MGGAIGVAGGAGLLLALFLPWYGDPASGETLSGWSALSAIDVICAACAAVSVAPELVRRTGLSVSYPVAGSSIATGAGALALALIVFRALDPPFDAAGADREPGIWIAALAAAAIVAGGVLGMKEDSPPSSG